MNHCATIKETCLFIFYLAMKEIFGIESSNVRGSDVSRNKSRVNQRANIAGLWRLWYDFVLYKLRSFFRILPYSIVTSPTCIFSISIEHRQMNGIFIQDVEYFDANSVILRRLLTKFLASVAL